MEMTGGEALGQQLVREGVRHVFGIPGVQLDWAMDGLAKVSDRIAFINPRHEQATSYMADGYARVSGDVGVCMVVPGPGVLNALAGLATAYACSSRVVMLAGQVPTGVAGRGLGVLHELPDQTGILERLTKWTGRAERPEDVPRVIREAFNRVRSGRPRPVAVELPQDVLQRRADAEVVEVADPAGPVAPDASLIEAAADRLRVAQRPLIYAGGGVLAAGGSEPLRRLAEMLQAPVVMSLNGRGALSNRHPLAVTSLGGRELLPEADVVLVVGSRFVDGHGNPVDTGEATTIHLNAEPADLETPRTPEVAIHGDAELGLSALVKTVGSLDGRPTRHDEVAAVRARCNEQVREVQPQWEWVQALRGAIPDDGILVNELTQIGYLSQVGYDVYEPRTYLTPGYQGTLGYGFATALGAKISRPDRPVVSICGDGGFGWNQQELATARQFDIATVTTVFNDRAFGNVKRTQNVRFEGRQLGTQLTNPDYLELASSYGIAGRRVTEPDEYRKVLEEAIDADEPTLIEVPVGEMPSAWHLILDFLAAPRGTG